MKFTGRMILMLAMLGSLHAYAETKPIKTLLVTGGHDFDPSFFTVFQNHLDIEYTHVEQPKANAMFADGSAMKFDTTVLYDMWMPISDREKAGLVKYLDAGKGLVALHHSIASYQDWPEFPDIIGATYILDQFKDGKMIGGKKYFPSTYRHDIWMDIKVADPAHPIVQGVKDFRIYDEGYKNYYLNPTAHILLTTEHPDSDPNVAWINTYKNNPIVYIQLGHGKEAFANPNFRHLVAQAIRFTAKRPLAVSLFNGNNLSGWEQSGNAQWKIEDGILIGAQGPNGEAGDLLTDKSFTNFELTVEFKMNWPGNSGVWFRFQSPDQAYQADILEWKDPVCWSGSLYCTGKMFLAKNENPSLVDRDGWNVFTIQCVDQNIAIDLNGTRIANVKDDTSSKGKIGFQVHAGDEFKNMAIHIKRVHVLPLH